MGNVKIMPVLAKGSSKILLCSARKFIKFDSENITIIIIKYTLLFAYGNSHIISATFLTERGVTLCKLY
jgi:hypothetical protein